MATTILMARSVLIPIGALLVITGGLIHGIWYAFREHKRKKRGDAGYR